MSDKQLAEVKQEAHQLALAEDFMGASGAGLDSFEKEDLAIPYLSILQDMSPQVKKRDGAYIEGAEPGMFLNTATEQLVDGESGVLLIPVAYQRRYTKWVPRNQGGGFLGEITQAEAEQAQFDESTSRNVLPDGNEAVTSADWFVLVVDPQTGAASQAVVSMPGTQLKTAKKWATKINSMAENRPDGQGVMTPPIFYTAWKAITVPQSNDKGSWFGWSITMAGALVEYGKDFKVVKGVKQSIAPAQLPNGPELYQLASEMRKGVLAGEVKASNPDGAEAVELDDSNLGF